MGTSERAAGHTPSGEERPFSDPSIVRFRGLIEVGLRALEGRREEVNALNEGPDRPGDGTGAGDTGDNMVLTLRAVVAELDRLAGATEGRTIDDIGRDEIVASVARAALLGARGNSGVILSQLIRGAAEELASRPGELIDPLLIGSALARASDQAYGSVRAPAEGTMLTVVRELSGRVASELAHRPEARLTPETTAPEQDLVIADVIQSALGGGAAGAAAVGEGGPDLEGVLAMVRDSGIFDAGGYGLIVLLAGIVGALRGSEAPDPPAAVEAVPLGAAAHSRHTSVTYRYCTNFAVSGRGLDGHRFTAALEALGDAVLVVGDQSTLKVHVHTDDPGAATAVFAGAGEVSHLDVVDMAASPQAGSRRPGAAAGRGPVAPAVPRSAVIALVDGDRLRSLFADLGAVVLGAGAGPYELLGVAAELEMAELVLLPTDALSLGTAERAAELLDRPVAIVRSASPQGGLLAAAVHARATGADDNVAAMTAALARVRTGSVGPAAADDPQGRFVAGDAIALVDGEAVAWGEPEAVLRDALARISVGADVVTALRGAQAPLDDEAVAALAVDGVPLTQSLGGQPETWWLLSAQ